MSKKRASLLMLCMIVLLIPALTGLTPPGSALATLMNIKLSGVMPAFGDVSPHQVEISPDGRFVVYAADQQTDGAFELWSVPTSGGAPVRLSGLMPAGTSLPIFAISPNGERVVYRAIQDNTGVAELYSVKLAGGQLTKLNAPLVAGGNVLNFEISPDSRRVVYEADQDQAHRTELYSVSITGGSVTRLNGALAGNGEVKLASSQISPDGRYVVYIAEQGAFDVDELYSVPIGGGPSTRLNDPLTSGGDVAFAVISPDSRRVVYHADQTTDNVWELYSAPIADDPVARLTSDGPQPSQLPQLLQRGGRSVKLNSALVPDGDVTPASALISPDSARVVYRADQQLDDVEELYSVPIAGGTATKLNSALAATGDVLQASISPDSSRIVYYADQQIDHVFELYSVPLAGGPVVKLNNPLLGDSVTEYAISPNNLRVVYTARQDRATSQDLYSVPLGGGASLKLNGASADGDAIVSPQFSSDGNTVIYSVVNTIAFETPVELYSAAMSGGAPTRLNTPLTSGRAVIAAFPDPTDRQVLYIADQERDDVFELYAARHEPAVATATSTATPANAATATAQASMTPTRTPTATSTPANAETATALASITPTLTRTPTETPANAETATAQSSITPTVTTVPGEAPDGTQVFLPLLTK